MCRIRYRQPCHGQPIPGTGVAGSTLHPHAVGYERVVGGAMWEPYQRWNEAIAEVVFSSDMEGLPVFLDLEEDVLARIGELADGDADPEARLIEVVRSTLSLRGQRTTVFREHQRRLNEWRRTDLWEAPPTLALLAFLSLAAEQMHAGDGMAANNYYGRVAQLLQLGEEELKRFITSYRKVSTLFWGALNDWLDHLEGLRGLPTAYALSHAHVGLPMSQALVRSTDRAKLSQMFGAYGLAPHIQLTSDVMRRIIDDWLRSVPSVASNAFEHLWADPSAQERIIELALIQLEAWDGSGLRNDTTGRVAVTHDLRLSASLRAFPQRELQVSLIAPSLEPSESTEYCATTADDVGAGKIEFIPATPAWQRLASTDGVDIGSLLEGLTELSPIGGGPSIRRPPRRLVPLVMDEMLQTFVETERVQLGADSLILSRREIANQVDEVLKVIARPGFYRWDELPGLPVGWVVFSSVQILSAPVDVPQGDDFNVLVPVAVSQLVMEHGLRLPGRTRKWSSLCPPELLLTMDSQRTVKLSIVSERPHGDGAAPKWFTEVSDAVVVVNTSDLNLPDGDYVISVAEIGKQQLLHRRNMRLRSGDQKAVASLHERRDLAYDLGAPGLLPAVSASRTSHGSTQVLGAVVLGDGPSAPRVVPSNVPSWYATRRTSSRQEVIVVAPNVTRIARVADDSCIYLGNHYMLLPDAGPARSSAMIEGRCKKCGLVKRYPPRAGWKRSERTPDRVVPHFDVSRVPPVTSHTGIDSDLALDSLSHVGSGPITWFEQVALQMDSSRLFVDRLLRTLEVLGHIQVRRDTRTLDPAEWEIAPPTLIGLGNGTSAYIGHRSRRLKEALQQVVAALGGTVSVSTTDGVAPSSIMIKDIPGEAMRLVADEFGALAGVEVRVAPDAARRLASVLPPLHQISQALPATPMMGARSVEWWNPSVARWSSVIDGLRPGAYKLTDLGVVYAFRSVDDVKAGTMRRANARVVKYLSAHHEGQSIVGYDSPTQTLYVPLGADLPALYGRAAVLASASPPIADENERVLRYPRVPPDIAGFIQSAVMS